MPCACGILLANAALRSLPLASPPLAPAPAALHRFGRDPNCGRPTSTEWERTGALASEGVVEGAVEEAGGRMVGGRGRMGGGRRGIVKRMRG